MSLLMLIVSIVSGVSIIGYRYSRI